MLNVVGVTYEHNPNYGSCLQAYALKETIENMQVGTEKCHYSLIPANTINKVKSWKTKINKMASNVFTRKFIPFYREHMDYCNVKSIKELESLSKRTDAFVCGSDVIWNSTHNRGNMDLYCLGFANKYKFSYAASFGKTDIRPELTEKTISLIKDLDSISVREKSAADVLQPIIGKKVFTALDPVFLLTRKQWNTIIPSVKKKEKYIFSYTTHTTQEYEGFLKKLSDQTGLKVISVKWRASLRQIKEIASSQGYPPEEWLRLLRDAEYVVTNSFHGTAFSVIFHKAFFTVISGDKFSGIYTRMGELLDELKLDWRIYNSVPETIDVSEFSYDEADLILAGKRKESLRFIQDNLTRAYEQKGI